MTLDTKIDQAIESLERKPIGGYRRTPARVSDRKKARAESRIAHRVARALPADVRRYFVEKYNAVAEDAFLRLLTGSDHVCQHCHCQQPSHQAVRSFFEMAGAVNAPSSTLIVNLIAKLGARDESELVSLVDSGRRLRALSADATASPDAFFEEALGLLEDCIRLDPERRAVALERLGGKPAEAE